MGNLTGHVALVTGAGRAAGMGRAIALRLAAAGADIAVVDIGRTSSKLDVPGVGIGDSEAELDETAELIRRLGCRSIAVPIDITDPESVSQGMAGVAEALGDVTVLVNNAGNAVGMKAFDQITVDDWELSFRANVLGAVNMIQAVLPGMRVNRSGSIVNVVSGLGLSALAEYGAYTVSEHAAVGLTRLLSQELAPVGIRVNAVAAGFIGTDMSKVEQLKLAKARGVTPDAVASDIIDDIPVRRLGLPADVAEAVAWLADPAANFVNGVVLPVHGGQMARSAR